ncbi:FIG002776: hypothetical protein [hydrothermal vent metagenome]|uniref:JmjC domain-containing protein n=1 Tax=hydrothermal vent metagenome TaxID=652676 RepID=A0A3B0W8M6_9ZZZZ
MIQFNNTSLKSFLTDFWQKKPLVLRNALPHFESHLSAEALAGLSLEEEIESRIVIQHEKKSYQLFKGPFTSQTYEKLPDTNWTLLIQGVDRLIPEVTELLNEFDFLPRWRIDDIMISYAVKGGNVGPHFDHYDVFLLQAAGQRNWKLTSQNCTIDNAIQGIDLRLMETFNVEEDFTFKAGDILYIPPKWGHHGIALDDECITYSIGYRSYKGQELWDSFGDHLCEMNAFKDLYIDPIWPEHLNTAEITNAASLQAQSLLQNILQDDHLIKTWFGRFATQLDQQATYQLPEPLTEAEVPSFNEFLKTVQVETGFIKDPVCRFAYSNIKHQDNKAQTLLYINGTIWNSFGASPLFIAQLANQSFLTPKDIRQACQNENNIKLLFDLWTLQYLRKV